MHINDQWQYQINLSSLIYVYIQMSVNSIYELKRWYILFVPGYALTFRFGKGVDKGKDIYHNENRVHIVYAQASP